jgi:tetratricopeptide (TPR) repeat protein
MKTTLCLITVILLAFSNATIVTAAGGNDRHLHSSGLASLKDSDFEKAIAQFSEAIAVNPRDYRYYSDRGVAHKMAGNLDLAILDYNKALEIKPNYTNALNNRGLAYLDQGNYDLAVRDFTEALKQGGLEGKIYTNLGLAYLRRGEHPMAVKSFDKAMSFQPLDYRSVILMGESWQMMAQPEKALKMYQLALALVKDDQSRQEIEAKISELSNKPQPDASVSNPEAELQKEALGSKSGEDLNKNQDAPPKAGRAVREITRAAPPAKIRHPEHQTRVESSKSVVERHETSSQDSGPLGAIEVLNANRNRIAVGKMSPAAGDIFRQGLQFLEKMDTTKALVRFDDTRQIERRQRNYHGVAWADLEIGRIHSKLGDHSKADSFFEESLRLFSKLDAKEEVILVLMELGANNRSAGKREKSANFYSKAMEDARQLGNPSLATLIGDIASGKCPPPNQTAGQPSESNRRALNNKPVNTAQNQSQNTARIENNNSAKEIGKTMGVKTEPKPYGHDNSFRLGPDIREAKDNSYRNENHANAKTSGSAETKQSHAQSQPERVVLWAKSNQENIDSHSKAPKEIVELSVSSRSSAGVETPPARKHAGAESMTKKLAESVAKTSKENVRPSQQGVSVGENAVRLQLSQLRELRQKHDEAGMVGVLESLSGKFIKIKEYEKALLCLNTAIVLKEKLNLVEGQDKMLRRSALLKEHLGRPAEALEDLSHAIALSETGRNIPEKTWDLSARRILGSMGIEPTEMLKAMKTLWKARELGDSSSETEILIHIARLYDSAGRNTEAIAYYDRASASINVDKAKVYTRINKQEEAEKLLSQSMEAFKKLDYSRYLKLIKNSENTSGYSMTATEKRNASPSSN